MNTQTRRRMYGGKNIEQLTWVGAASDVNTGCIEFDVGILLTSTMKFAYDVYICGKTWQIVVAAASSRSFRWATDKNILDIYYNSSGNFDLLYFSTQTLFQTGTYPQIGRHLFEFNNGFLIDNVRKTTVATPSSLKSGSMWITGYRIYSFKVWDNDELIADFVPAKSGNKYGLYDTIEKKFIEPTTGTITGA